MPLTGLRTPAIRTKPWPRATRGDMQVGATGRFVTAAILQAPLSSSRLPGKVLLPLCGDPMLMRQIERIRRAKLVSRFVVATSTSESDAAIAALCAQRGIETFRGSLDDVLDRVY